MQNRYIFVDFNNIIDLREKFIKLKRRVGIPAQQKSRVGFSPPAPNLAPSLMSDVKGLLWL
jgi:hypothetical protein